MPQGHQRRHRRAGLFNVLALVCLGLSVVSVGWVTSVAIDPYGQQNPFPPARPSQPPTPMAAVTNVPVVTMTATASDAAATRAPSPLPETTAFIEPTLEATPSATPLPTVDLSPALGTAVLGTAVLGTAVPGTAVPGTATATATPRPSPTYSPFTYTAVITLQVHPVQVCDWMGMAGTVTDLNGRHALGAFVHVWGLGNFDQTVAVGANPVYGPSGWEVRLARAQIVGNWNVQLVASPEAARSAPLSDVYTVSMPGDCKKNLALVSLQQNH